MTGSISTELERPTIRVFGAVSLQINGEPVSIGGPRQRKLLALLAIRAGSVVDIDWLAEHLWTQDERPEATTPPLRTYMSRLRSALPEAAQSWFVTEPNGYRLAAPPGAVESDRFSRLRAQATQARDRNDPLSAIEFLDEALGLWRDEPFRDLEDLDWARSTIERLNLDRLEMLEERWEAALALGRHTQITGELAAFTSEHGLRDRAARQHALALHRSGRTPEALRVIGNHRRTIAEETGLDPSPEVIELEQALFAGGPSLLLESNGRPLRGYRLIEEAGVGAFAIVWRGVQPSVDREVAIKQIRSELASQPEFIRRFEAEAHMVARIEHPHIVPLIDFWRDPDSAYLIMRWLPGGTLELRLDDGPLPLSDTLILARQIGGALTAAHNHGVIHRDVKTGNILFDDSGNAFLGDFGIALEASESAGPEAALSPGSPAYSSPEQIRREKLGPEADVFSLGVVIYECLVGALPFGALSVPDLMDRQLTEPYPALHELRSDIPESLSAAVEKATAKEAAERFPTIAAFLDALEPGSAPIETTAVQAQIDATNPYKGLRAFDDADAEEFFGRERLASELIDRLSGTGLASRGVVLVGPSGSGKSSVAKAGLVPALRSGAVPDSDDWFVTTMVPGTDPFESLEAALLRIAVNSPATLLSQLRDGTRGVLRGARRCLKSDDERILLVIDQFEELFTGASAEDANQFLDAFTVAATDPSSPIRFLLTLRADYYDRPLAHPGFAPVLKETAVDITPLAPDELERAIVEPARRQGVTFEPGLVARMAADTIGQPAPLPLLQYALSELFERREGALLAAASYEEIGGLSGALAARAEAIHTDANETQRTALRRLFGRMTNPTQQSSDLRRRAQLTDLGDDDATQWAIDALGSARLVTFDRDTATREPTIEVAHESLLREWPRLVDWLQEDLELLRSIDAISDAASAWAEGGRATTDLYRGGRLDNAIGLTVTTPDRLRPLEADFVDASRTAAEADRDAERRSVRRLRRLVSAVGVALVVALVAGGLALRSQQQANDEAQSARESAAEAQDQTEFAQREAAISLAATEEAELATLISRSAGLTSEDAEVALLLALEAHQRERRPDTQQAILAALAANTRAESVSSVVLNFNLEGTCNVQLPSPDATVEYLTRDGQLAIRDFSTGSITTHGPPPEECVSWFIDAQTSRRWAGSLDGLRGWTAEADGPWVPLRTFEETSFVQELKFRPSGLLVYQTGDAESAVLTLVDDTTGEIVGQQIDISGKRGHLVNDDGSLIIASFADSDSAQGRIKMFDGQTGSELWESPTSAPVSSATFNPDAGQVLVGLEDGTIALFATDTGEVTTVLQTTATDNYLDIGIRPDGLIVAVTPTQIELIDPRTGPTGVAVELRDIIGAAVRPDGTVLTTSFATNSLGIVDLDVSALVESAMRIEPGSAVTMNGNHAGVTLPSSGVAERIDMDNGTRASIELVDLSGNPFRAEAVFADGGGLWGIDASGQLARWEDDRLVEQFATGTGYVDGSRRDDYFASVSGEPGSRRAILSSLNSGDSGALFEVDVANAALAQPRGDGGMYVLDSTGVLFEYDTTGAETNRIETGVENATTLSLDAAGRTLAAASLDGGLVVDSRTGNTTALPDIGFASGVGFAEDDASLVVTTLDGTVRLWDIASASTTATLWSGSGAVVGSPSRYDESTRSLWVGSSGRLLNVSLDPDRWVEQACGHLQRDLSTDEWDRLVPGEIPQRSACRETLLGPEWERGATGPIPPGNIRLPEFGGIQFDLDAERLVYQDRAFTILRVQEEPVFVEVNLVAPTATPDGEPITNVEELIAGLTDFVGHDLVELEQIETPIGTARTFDFTHNRDRVNPATAHLRIGEGGWDPWQFGRIWLLDTERGVFMVTAETQDLGSDVFPETIDTAETLLATIELIDL